ncbi:MAG: hypothetical protein RLY15_1137 [Bacteroidota bacterium]
MVKRLLFFTCYFICFLISIRLNAQTGIGTTTPNASAKLDVFSTNKGFLPPRVSLIDVNDRATIPSPATGLLVYCKGDAGLAAGYYFWNGYAWATIATEGGSGSVTAEFGTELLASTSISVSSSTRIEILTFDLPSAGTWEIIYFMRAQSATQGFAAEFAIYDASNVLVPNSEILCAYGENSSTGTGVIRITTTGPATYKMKAWATTGTYSAISDNNGRTGATWKKISGNAPVTGQTIDYGIVKYTGTDTGSLTAGNIVAFDSNASGNLPWSGNKFILKANKTYELESYLAIYLSGAGVAGIFQIYDYTNSNVLASGLYMSMNGSGGNNPSGNGLMRAIVTPTNDIQVGVKFISSYGGTPGLIGSANYVTSAAPNQCYFMAKQIGSSAIVNPWVLSGNDSYNISGNVGIGTNAPDVSAILDVSSSSKGLLPPRVALAARNGTSSPISSPTAGLLVYNTATAGTSVNAVSPGFYFYNGSIWTRMDPEGWSAPVPITIGAVTSAPTKGTIVYDKVSYRRTSTTSYDVTYNYAQSTPGSAGSGDYLFSLPAGLSFGSNVLTTNSTVYETVINRAIIGTGILAATDANRFRAIAIVPYDSTKFRLVVTSSDNTGQIIDSATLGLNFDGISYKFSFILDTN